MARISNLGVKRIVLGCGAVALLLAVTFVLTGRTHGQQSLALDQRAENAEIEQIENSGDRSLRIVGNDESPFRIVRARVKEVSGARFTRLTGRTTDLAEVSTVPEVELFNTSGKTITAFVVGIRDPQSRTTRTLSQRAVSIAPGESYIMKREHFLTPQPTTVADGNGKFHQSLIQPKKSSEKYWLSFASRSDIYIAVGGVTFDDGTKWMIAKGGDFQ